MKIRLEVKSAKMQVARAALHLLLLICVLSVRRTSGHRTCSLGSKTRSGEECTGKLRRMTPEMVRYIGTSTDAWACSRHWIRIKRELNGFCACPLPKHSEQLHSLNIPERLISMFYRIGEGIPGYRRGSRWCNQCYQTAEQQFKNEPDYRPPKKVFLSSLFSSKILLGKTMFIAIRILINIFLTNFREQVYVPVITHKSQLLLLQHPLVLQTRYE